MADERLSDIDLQTHIDSTPPVRMSHQLARELLALRQSAKQWEQDWHDGGDYQLIKDALDGISIAPAPGSVAERVLALCQSAAEARRAAFEEAIAEAKRHMNQYVGLGYDVLGRIIRALERRRDTPPSKGAPGE